MSQESFSETPAYSHYFFKNDIDSVNSMFACMKDFLFAGDVANPFSIRCGNDQDPALCERRVDPKDPQIFAGSNSALSNGMTLCDSFLQDPAEDAENLNLIDLKSRASGLCTWGNEDILHSAASKMLHQLSRLSAVGEKAGLSLQ